MNIELLKSINVPNNILDNITDSANHEYCMFMSNVLEKDLKHAEYYLEFLRNTPKYKKIADFFHAIITDKTDNIKLPFRMDKKDYKVFISFIENKQYRFASDLLEEQGYDSYEFQLLRSILISKKDLTRYIYADVYKPEELREPLKKLERCMYVYLRLHNKKKMFEIFNKLKYLNKYDYNFFEVYESLLDKYNEMVIDDNLSSSHCSDLVVGDINNVIAILLESNDLYRIQNVIKENVDKYDIQLLLFEEVMNRIMRMNHEHIRDKEAYIKENMNIMGSNLTLDSTELTRLSRDIIDLDKTDDLDEDIDYYNLYLNHYHKGEFKQALNALVKHQSILRRKGQEVNFNYLIKELRINIDNSEYIDDNYLEIFKRAYESFYLFDYRGCIKYVDEISGLFYNPKLETLRAMSLSMLELDEEAVEVFKTIAEYYISPEAVLYFITSLCELKDYENVIYYGKKYENLDEQTDTRYYYIMAIAYYNLGKYKEALNCIESCEAIYVTYSNLPIVLEDERNIITDAMKGNKKEKFTMEDYIDYSLDDDEEQLMMDFEETEEEPNRILKELERVDRPIREKIIYLLSVNKVLLSMEIPTEVIMNKLDELIDQYDDDECEKKSFKKELKNYRNI